MTSAPQTAATLLGLFAGHGYSPIEPAIVQPADLFLDLSGEDLRSRMMMTADSEGQEMVLRPEYTIPVAAAYLASAQAGQVASYAYGGPVFRLRTNEPFEFMQAGIESFGRRDREAADAEVLGLALEATGLKAPTIRLGDVGLFLALLDALALPAAMTRRLRRAFAAGTLTPATLEAVASPAQGTLSAHEGVARALEGQDSKAARAFVEDLLKIAGITTVGGRSAGEIAERFLEQASASAQGFLPPSARDTLAAFLGIEGDPDSASAALRTLATTSGLALDAAIDSFDQRTGFMAARGLAVEDIQFSAAFGRNLDYYTGVVFEVRHGGEKPVIGGGRYDGLLTALGASGPIPAVGCAIFVDRLNGGAA